MPTEFEWSRCWSSSRVLKIWWKTFSVNLSSSTTGSSSCQCTATLYGENEETQKGVNIIHRQLRIMLADSLAVVGHSWDLGQKRNDTEPTLINPTEPGTKLPNKWCWILQQPNIRALSCHIALDMLCQEMHEVERRRGWFGFWARLV